MPSDKEVLKAALGGRLFRLCTHTSTRCPQTTQEADSHPDLPSAARTFVSVSLISRRNTHAINQKEGAQQPVRASAHQGIPTEDRSDSFGTEGYRHGLLLRAGFGAAATGHRHQIKRDPGSASYGTVPAPSPKAGEGRRGAGRDAAGGLTPPDDRAAERGC